MGQKSRLDTLPEVKAHLDKLIQQGRFTQKQLAELATEYVKELGHDTPITEKVVNRYASAFKGIIAKREQSALVVKQWVAKMGDVPDGDFGRAMIEILRQLSLDMSLAITEQGVNSDKLPETVRMLKELSTSVKQIEQSASENAKREAELKKRIREEAAQELTEELKNDGISPELEDSIRRILIGR